ncbi:MAG: MMPL family transporter [Bacteroidales bacterium]|nr:MMPL family transporter [Bacteroidales bacterium]
METLFRSVLKLRWVIIFIVLASTLFLGLQIPKIRINSDVISSLPDDDPDALLLKKIGAKFGGNKTGMIILETENVFTTEVLRHVKQVTDTLKEVEGISSVTSLTSIMHVNEGEDGMEIGQLVDENDLPDSPEELASLKEKVFKGTNYKGTIVSEDGTSTIIIFSLADDADIHALANTVKEKTEALRLPEKVYYAGSPMMITSISHLISSDLTRLLPIAFILIVVVLFFGFRTVRGVVVPLIVAILSIIWVIGIMSLTGSELSMVTNNIPIVLLAVGTAYAIHVLNRIDQVKGDLNQAVMTAMTYVFIPVILAALTTITGFISFIFGSYLTMIRDFGIFTALGTFIALLLSLFFVPAMIAAFGWKNRKEPAKKRESGKSFFAEHFQIPLQRMVFNHTKGILAGWIIVTIISIGGMFLIKRNVDVRNYFRKGDPTRIAEDIMTREFGGTKPVFVYFKGDVQSPELLNTMLRTEEYMKKIRVSYLHSLLPILLLK